MPDLSASASCLIINLPIVVISLPVRFSIVHSDDTMENSLDPEGMQHSPTTSDDSSFETRISNYNAQKRFLALKYRIRLQEILYPTSKSFPRSLDLSLWLMRIGDFGPTKRLVKVINCLAIFIKQRGTKRPIHEFIDAARLELKNDGWSLEEKDKVNLTSLIDEFISQHPWILAQIRLVDLLCELWISSP